jgi:sulfate transport system ATP-binding protein
VSIEVRHITRKFGKFAALQDVSLEVRSGELMALLGPSGSGKTTLLRIIAGLEVPDPVPGSAVLFRDEDVSARNAAERQVGFVFQHYALFRNMTVFENVAFGLRVQPRKSRPSPAAIRSRVFELLELVHLDDLANRYPSQLSGGQRQRVALARALAIQPQVLLLDEPFGALDAKVRLGLRTWLRKLHDELHVTTVLVTHDQEEALEVADRIVVMHQGRIEQVGTPDEVFHHPASEFTMEFLGSVNLFHGRIESGKAVFGPLVVDRPAPVSDGAAARLFVRPHELDISACPNGKPSLRARVRRIQSAGAQVKVDLLCETGEPVNVHMAHERFRELHLSPEDEVFVSLRDGRVFVEDYRI